MTRTVLRGGRVVCPASGRDALADLVVCDGRIEGLAPSGSAGSESSLVVDVDGCHVLPGAIDLACHLREPGREEEEPLALTLKAAARGGFTTVVGLPDTDPVVDGADDVLARQKAAPARGPGLSVAGALTRDGAGEQLAEIGEMVAAGARLFTDAPRAVADAGLLRHAMDYAAGFGATVFAWGDCPALRGAGVVAEGAISTRLGLPAIPEAAETSLVSRHIDLCRLTGARTVVGPISSAAAGERIRAARQEGLPLFGAVLPWHLAMDETQHLQTPYDVNLRLEPPLRTPADREALLQGVREGDLLLVSGHRPVGLVGREVEFERAEPGAISLEIALPLLMSGPDDGGLLSPLALARAFSLAPAEALGLTDRGSLRPGARADITVLDPRRGKTLEGSDLVTRVLNSPWLGRPLAGAVRLTLCGGETIYDATRARGEEVAP